MTENQANLAASVLAFVIQLAMICCGVYFLSEGLRQPLEFLQIFTISCALLIIRSGMSVRVTRNS